MQTSVSWICCHYILSMKWTYTSWIHMMIYKTTASSPHIKPELLMFTPSCCSPSDVKNVSVMTAMSGGLQESQLGVWDIPRLIQQLCPKSRVEQCVCVCLSSTESSDSACYCSPSCMPVIAAVWPCREPKCSPFTQRITASVLLSYEATIWVWQCLCVLLFPASSGPLWLRVLLWLWVHPVSSQEWPPSPAYDMV